MSDIIVGDKQDLVAVADSIRSLIGGGQMYVSEMATNINGAKTAVDAALTAISEKGVEVPDGTKVDGLAALIAEIESGGGGSSGSINGIVEMGTFTPNEEITEISFEVANETMLVKSKKFAVFTTSLLANGTKALVFYDAHRLSTSGSQAMCSMLYGDDTSLKGAIAQLRSGVFGELVNIDIAHTMTLKIPDKYPYNSGGCVFGAGITYTYIFME